MKTMSEGLEKFAGDRLRCILAAMTKNRFMGVMTGVLITTNINIEHEINNYRTQLKNQNLQDVNSGQYSYQLGVFYVDFISECEKLGYYVMNCVGARTGA